MVKVVILEGVRGAGKSTLARMLKSTLSSSTLINFTGFKEDGILGLKKIERYYKAALNYLETLSSVEGDFVVIFDRMFISELVYSRIYKEYNFTTDFLLLTHKMRKFDVSLFHVTATDDDIFQRTVERGKKDFFHIAETDIPQQREEYEEAITKFLRNMVGTSNRLTYLEIDTSLYDVEEALGKIIETANL